MKIIFIESKSAFFGNLAEELSNIKGLVVVKTAADRLEALKISEKDVIVIDAGVKTGRDQSRKGLELFQRLRRERRYKNPVIVCSEVSVEELSKRYSIVRSRTGNRFVQIPTLLDSFVETLSQVADEALDDDGLESIIRWDSGLEGEWSNLIHSLFHYFIDVGQCQIDSDFHSLINKLTHSVSNWAIDRKRT
ncbi:MAG: hypothetical protein IPK01_00830 [Acidobacteria bacterium]|nr:hypothetical protein [Acidobacteriota bacterium]